MTEFGFNESFEGASFGFGTFSMFRMHTQPKLSINDPLFLDYMLSRVSDPIESPVKLSPKRKKEQYRSFMFEEVIRVIHMSIFIQICHKKPWYEFGSRLYSKSLDPELNTCIQIRI